jgi:replicative DNA helicase
MADDDRSRAAPTARSLASLFEQLPPHAVEAEMSLLGSILIDPNVLTDIIMTLRSPDEFFKPAHGSIYRTMIDLYEQHAALDIVQLHQVLVDRKLLDTVGGPDYLVELASAVPTATNAAHYARLVHEKAVLRQLIDAAGRILTDAYESAESGETILNEAEHRIFEIAQHSERSRAESLADLIEQTIRILEENEGRQITGVPTGFSRLDEMTGGMQRGEMIILAARPSMGKTALALNIAEQVAFQGHPVAVFSLEMGKQQLVQRLLCATAGIDSQRLRRNMLHKDEWHRLHQACDTLTRASIYIDDTPGLTMLQLRAKARRLKARYDIDAIVIDYLQLLTSGRRAESRQQEVSEISRGIKAMARELEVPVLTLSQLNRAAEQREGHRPRMSDLRESGSIEQDADVITMLHREEYYHRNDPGWSDQNPDKAGVAELIITKQRNGPTGTVKLTWVEKSTRFRDHTNATPPEDIGPADNGRPPRGNGSPPRRPNLPPPDSDDFDVPF